MATHPICADLVATDDRGSRGGHLRSNDITVRFLPISRDRKEIETCKWCQATWLVEPLQAMCMLTYLGIDLSLTWPEVKFWNWPFKIKNAYFEPAWWGEHGDVFFIFVSLMSKKLLMKNHFREKNINFSLTDLWAETFGLTSNLIERRYRGMRRATKCFCRILPSYHTFGDNWLFSKKWYFLDIWPLVTPVVTSILIWPESDLSKSLRSRRGLSFAVYRLSLSTVVFEFGRGGGRKGPLGQNWTFQGPPGIGLSRVSISPYHINQNLQILIHCFMLRCCTISRSPIIHRSFTIVHRSLSIGAPGEQAHFCPPLPAVWLRSAADVLLISGWLEPFYAAKHRNKQWEVPRFREVRIQGHQTKIHWLLRWLVTREGGYRRPGD